MVKVQKPLPKSLNKLSKVETTIKKKTTEKTKLKTKEAVLNVPSSKKEKKLLLEKTVKDGALITAKPPPKKEKTKENVKTAPVAVAATTTKKAKKDVEQPQQQQQQEKKKSKAAPLVLAPPPESPVIVQKTKSNKRKATPLVLAPPPESPAAKPKAKPTAVKPQAQQKTKQTKVAPVAAVPQKSKTAKAAKQSKKEKQPKTAAAAAQPLTKKQRTKAVKRAFLKQKRAKKLSDAEPTAKKLQQQKRQITYEPVAFDEAKFHAIVSAENVQKIAGALKQQVAEEVKKQKTSIFDDYRYFLNVGSFKIANVPRRMVKLNLKHSIVSKDDSVAIIVPDLQRGAKIDYDPTIQHYEDLFREAGIERLKIVPFNQLRNEMNTFETKRKFCNTYDFFLCDGRIAGQAHAYLGKYTQKPRTVLHAVRLEKSNLKQEIERGLCRTAFRQLQHGDLVSIPVGNHHFTEQQLADNIMHVTEQLKSLHAGGLANIRSLYLKIDIKGTSSLPLYVSMNLPPPATPYVIGTREQRMIKLKQDANKVLSQFTLTKEAKLIKLNPEQVENKRKLREAHAKLTQKDVTAKISDLEDDDDDDDDDDNEPKDNDNDNKTVPAKKPRKDKEGNDDSDDDQEGEADSDEDGGNDSDEGDEEVGSGDDDDGDDDGEDEGEGADSDEDGDNDDDENEDDEDDEDEENEDDDEEDDGDDD